MKRTCYSSEVQRLRPIIPIISFTYLAFSFRDKQFLSQPSLQFSKSQKHTKLSARLCIFLAYFTCYHIPLQIVSKIWKMVSDHAQDYPQL